MQALHVGLKQDLLAQHAHLGLTAEVLRRYDGLLQLHCDLCRAAQTCAEAFHWPYQEQTRARARAAASSAEAETTPFQKMQMENPTTAQEALRVVENTMSAVIDQYMPYFHSVHAQWARAQQRESLRTAKRAYGW